jgi:hypothetical protein
MLFAYAAGQLGGRLVPLLNGLGGVEGGALTLTDTPPTAAAAAVIVYRVAGYWAVGATGIAVAAALARQALAHTRAWPWRVRHRVVGTVVPWAATDAVHRVAAGESALDPNVVARLVGRKRKPAPSTT